MELVSRQEALQRGLTKYRTGNSCKHGHNAERWVATCACVVCQRKLSARQHHPSAPGVTADEATKGVAFLSTKMHRDDFAAVQAFAADLMLLRGFVPAPPEKLDFVPKAIHDHGATETASRLSDMAARDGAVVVEVVDDSGWADPAEIARETARQLGERGSPLERMMDRLSPVIGVPRANVTDLGEGLMLVNDPTVAAPYLLYPDGRKEPLT